MTRVMSLAALQSIHAQETGEVWLPMVKLAQDDWTLRVVPNGEPITHQGELYNPYAFDVRLPDETVRTLPAVEWAADNVDQRLIEGLRQVSGVVDARVVWVRAAEPDLIEIGPLLLKLRKVSYTATVINGVLAMRPLFDMPFVNRIFNPTTAPGLY